MVSRSECEHVVMRLWPYLDGAVSAEGRPVQWSRNYFLPGKLSLRLVRDMPGHSDPAIVLQLFADT